MTSMARQRPPRSRGPPLPIDFEALDFLAHGTSGAVYGIDKDWVLKEYWELDHGAIERRALTRLGSHPNIIGYFGEIDSKYIILERGEPFLSLTQRGYIPVEKKLAWIRDLAEGLWHIHQLGIIHADVGCENVVIIDDQLKIIDFEGCSIDGSEANAGYKWYNRKGSSVDLQSDIFAYGCATYQILTGRPTLHELAESDDRSNLARRLYAEHRFPDVQGLPLSDLILRCWSGQFKSMKEVVATLNPASAWRFNVAKLSTNIWNWIFGGLKSVINRTLRLWPDIGWCALWRTGT